MYNYSCYTQDAGEESQNKPFYDDDDDDADEGDSEEQKKEEKTKKTYTLDPDHRLLLRNTKPLLQSRNASVRHGYVLKLGTRVWYEVYILSPAVLKFIQYKLGLMVYHIFI